MRTYGWYLYQEDPWKMVNIKSGQTLELKQLYYKNLSGDLITKNKTDTRPRLIKALFPNRDPVHYSSEFTFLYKDNEIEQTVQLIINYQNDKFKRFGITIDYNSWLKNPSYGLWRRLDDFLTDAALCWPEGVFEERPFGLTVQGAWFQGKWNPYVRRRFSGRKAGTLTQMEGKYISDPILEPLNLPIPLQWRYIDHEKTAPEVALEFDKDESGILYISNKQNPSGFQGKTPYLIRSDGNAAIFLSKLTPVSHRGEDPSTDLYYTFIDQDVFFTFRSCLWYNLQISTLHNYGVRRIPPEKNWCPANIFGAEEDFSTKPAYPSYRVWRKTLNALMDAWPNWESGKKVEIDSSIELPPNYGRIGYLGNYGPSMSYGFCGGYSNHWYEINFKILTTLAS